MFHSHMKSLREIEKKQRVERFVPTRALESGGPSKGCEEGRTSENGEELLPFRTVPGHLV